jgi:glycosyltransferase involved in cell wall biosynthesis
MVANLRGARIARVSTVPYFVVSQLGGQIEYLSKTGALVVVVTSAGPELQRLSSEDISVENIEIPRSISPLKDAIALFQLFLCFRRNHFDIVHSTTPKAGLLCAVAGVLARVPVRLHTFTGQPWVSLTGPHRLLARWADWVIGRLATNCYTDSESQREFLIAEGVVPAAKIGVLGRGSLAGVNLQRFNSARWAESEKMALRRELGLSESGYVILFVGRVTRDKGVGELISAFDAVIQKGFDADLLLVGPLDSERGGMVELTDAVMGGLQRVHRVGYSDCPERYMAIADFLCLPSYREGFGTVVIEAAAMGLPTLGTRIYGLSDAVEDGVTGMLVPPRDSEALANAMLALLEEPDHLASMGQVARARCIEHFDADKVNALVAEEYVRLLSCEGVE